MYESRISKQDLDPVSFNNLEDLAVMVVYANPKKSVSEIASAVGLSRYRLRTILGTTEAKIVFLMAETFGAPEDLTNFHITNKNTAPNVVTGLRNPPAHLLLILENMHIDSPYYPLKLLELDFGDE